MSDALEIKPNSVHITTVHYYCVFFDFYASDVTTKAQKVFCTQLYCDKILQYKKSWEITKKVGNHVSRFDNFHNFVVL